MWWIRRDVGTPLRMLWLSYECGGSVRDVNA
jgi:hypothetical protein